MPEPDPPTLIPVRVQPRARRDEVVGVRNGAVLVRVTAPPVDGRANEAVRRLVARALGVSAGRVEVVRGAGSRDKALRVRGADPERLAALLRGAG